jgi:hypothetical protein
MAISEFAAWLRGQTNKHKRPFQEHTITCVSASSPAVIRTPLRPWIDRMVDAITLEDICQD